MSEGLTSNPLELLKKTKVEVSPESYAVVSLQDEQWRKLLENPAYSPRMSVPFMIFKDRYEITLLLDDADYQNCLPAIQNCRAERGWRLLTFTLALDFSVVGYFALISKILAEAGIPIMALSAFSRDHILLKQEDLAKALIILGEYVEDLC